MNEEVAGEDCAVPIGPAAAASFIAVVPALPGPFEPGAIGLGSDSMVEPAPDCTELKGTVRTGFDANEGRAHEVDEVRAELIHRCDAPEAVERVLDHV